MTRLVTMAVALAMACYRVPTPTCGFRCGPDGECPTDYTCSSLEDRCHRNGTDPTFRCDTDEPQDDRAIRRFFDAPVDSPNDAGSDAPNDAPNDAGVDAMPDAG